MDDKTKKDLELSDQEDVPNSLSEGDIIEMIGENGETVDFIFIEDILFEKFSELHSGNEEGQ